MGNDQTRGIGVLNNSNIREINVGLSMGPTHYFENGIKPGEIFYQRTGAVHYTVYAFARQPDEKNDIIKGQVANAETFGAFIFGGVTISTMGAMLSPAAVALAPLDNVGEASSVTTQGITGAISGAGAYPNASSAEKALGLALEGSKLYCEKKGCYGGGLGSWLVVEGGPYMDDKGVWNKRDLTIREATQEQLFLNGNFTKSSHDRFKTNRRLQCTENCPHC